MQGSTSGKAHAGVAVPAMNSVFSSRPVLTRADVGGNAALDEPDDDRPRPWRA
jgi:hypothetical protein